MVDIFRVTGVSCGKSGKINEREDKAMVVNFISRPREIKLTKLRPCLAKFFECEKILVGSLKVVLDDTILFDKKLKKYFNFVKKPKRSIQKQFHSEASS